MIPPRPVSRLRGEAVARWSRGFAVTAVLAWCAAAPAFAKAPAKPKPPPVVIIGVDGATFDVLDPLVAAGKLPHLAALLESGSRAVMRSEKPMRSPALWTTVATGQPRQVHEIYDFVTGNGYWPKARRGGKRRLVTTAMRRVPALWNLASAAHRKPLVVGWLNTWPAEPVDGVIVAPYVALRQAKQTSIKGRVYSDAARQTHPRAAFDRLKRFIVPSEEVDPKRVAAIVAEPPKGSPLYEKVPGLERYLYTVRWSVASNLTNTGIVEHELGRTPFDLVMTYFDGSDTLAHRFWVLRQPLEDVQARLSAQGLDPALAPELQRRLGRAVEGYYELVDESVGRVLEAAGPNANVMLLSDHGWGDYSGGAKAPHEHVPFDGEHRLDGLFIAHGPAFRAGEQSKLTLYDVAPTALYLMGLPVPTKLPGRVATELMTPEHLAAHPVRSSEGTAAVEKPPTPAPDQAPFRETQLERLRSLGYVQ